MPDAFAAWTISASQNVVEGSAPYWLHLEVRADATLKTLDAFLRLFGETSVVPPKIALKLSTGI